MDTTLDQWENCLALFICGIGLVLFAYHIGNMQQSMLSSKKQKAVRDKIQKKERELLEWTERHGLANLSIELRKEIRANIQHKLEEENNTSNENLYCLPESLQHELCMIMLKRVPIFEDMDHENGLRMICDYLKPVIYTRKSFVFRVGEPLDSMLFIVEGTVIIYNTSSTTDSPSMIHGVLEDDGVYGGEQLMIELGINTQRHTCLLKKPAFLHQICEMSYESRRLYSHGQRLENCVARVKQLILVINDQVAGGGGAFSLRGK